MAKRSLATLLLAALLVPLAGCLAPTEPEPAPTLAPAIAFEPNVGQAASGVDFVARSLGAPAAFGRDRFWSPSGVETVFADARAVVPEAGSRLPGHTNVYLGDPDAWMQAIPHHASITYRGLYPGVDLVFRSQDGELKYDLVGASAAALAPVTFEVQGHVRLALDGDALLVEADGQSVRHEPPVSFHPDGTPAKARYDIRGPRAFGWHVEPAIPGAPVTIDPVILDYASYAGGTQADPWGGIAQWNSETTMAGQAFAGAGFPPNPPYGAPTGPSDGVLLQYNPWAGVINWVTLFGGSADDAFTDIVAGDYGFVTSGWTSSPNLPVSASAAQILPGGQLDAFVAAFDPSGAWLASTYLGGSGDDQAWGIASRKVQSLSEIAVTGTTHSLNFPMTPGAYDLLGPLPTERDAFATVLRPNMALAYSTYLGGLDLEWGEDISFQENGGPLRHVAVVGSTSSTNYPTTVGAYQPLLQGIQDAFVTLIDPGASGSASLAYSTYLGGPSGERGQGVQLTLWGTIDVAGASEGLFPTTPGAFQPLNPGNSNGFLSEIKPAGLGPLDLLYSTYLGGSLSEGAIGFHEMGGWLYTTGGTSSSNFPVSAGAFQPALAGNADIFLTAFHRNGPGVWTFAWSTYFGGVDFENSFSVSADRKQYVAVMGLTGDLTGPTFPLGPAPPFQPSHAGGTILDWVVFNAHCDLSGPC